MTGQHRQPERRAPRWLKWINPINRFLLKRGLGPPRQHLLITTGRKSGKTRTTPVAVVEFEGERYLVAGFDGSDWVKNARTAGRGQLQRGRTLQDVALVEIPLEQRPPILNLFARTIRGGQAFLTVSPSAPHSAFVQAAPRHPIFRLAEIEPSQKPSGGADRG